MKIISYVNRVFAVGKALDGNVLGKIYMLDEADYAQFHQFQQRLEMTEQVKNWILAKKDLTVVDDLRIEFVEYFKGFSQKASERFFDFEVLKMQTIIHNIPKLASLYMMGISDVSLIWSVFVPAISAGFREFMDANKKEILSSLSYVTWDDHR